MVLPLLKLGTLAVKTLSKPFASIKKQAAYQPRFREFIIRIPQANHRFQTQVQRRIYSHSTDVAISRPLNEEKAIQANADRIGEIILCTGLLGATVIVGMQAIEEAKKEEIRKQELEEVRQREDELAKELELLRLKRTELEQLAKGKGLSGPFSLKHSQTEGTKLAKPA